MKKTKFLLLLCVMLVALPSVIIPVNTTPVTEVTREKDIYFFRIRGCGVSIKDAHVEFEYKNLSPEEQWVTLSANDEPLGIINPVLLGDERTGDGLWTANFGDVVTFTLTVKDVDGNTIDEFSGSIVIPPPGSG